MGEINMMTWNVDWCRNGKRSGKDYEYIYSDCSQDICDSIINIVKGFLEKENAVVFLQEFPYMRFADKKGMIEHELWQRLNFAFSNIKYDIFFDKTNKNVLRYTIAIAKKDVFTKDKDFNFGNNRIISVKKAGVTLMGVHMPTDFENNSSEERMWLKLIESLEKCSHSKQPLIITGDFNAFIGCNDVNANKLYGRLKAYTEDVVPPLLKTFADITTVDHILINNAAIKTISKCSLDFEMKRKYSDHRYLIAKFME